MLFWYKMFLFLKKKKKKKKKGIYRKEITWCSSCMKQKAFEFELYGQVNKVM